MGYWKIIIPVILFLFPSGFIYANQVIKQVCIKNICVHAEIADSDFETQRGLMDRKSMSDDESMLFLFEKEDRYAFWMKNMQFALDIIWIDGNRRIVDTAKNVPPCKETCESIFPALTARYVLEVNAGWVEKHKIKIGDEVKF